MYVVSEIANQEHVICKLLDCDSVTQAKEKALDALFRNTPFSQRLPVRNVDLGQHNDHAQQYAKHIECCTAIKTVITINPTSNVN